MLHVVFFGMDLRILDALMKRPIHLCGVYLPPAPYRFLRHPPWYLKFTPRFMIKKRLKTAAVYAGVDQYVRHHKIAALQAKQVSSRKLRKQLADCGVDLGVVANFGQRIDSGRCLFRNLVSSITTHHCCPNTGDPRLWATCCSTGEDFRCYLAQDRHPNGSGGYPGPGSI